jgi:hypothetical protein
MTLRRTDAGGVVNEFQFCACEPSRSPRTTPGRRYGGCDARRPLSAWRNSSKRTAARLAPIRSPRRLTRPSSDSPRIAKSTSAASGSAARRSSRPISAGWRSSRICRTALWEASPLMSEAYTNICSLPDRLDAPAVGSSSSAGRLARGGVGRELRDRFRTTRRREAVLPSRVGSSASRAHSRRVGLGRVRLDWRRIRCPVRPARDSCGVPPVYLFRGPDLRDHLEGLRRDATRAVTELLLDG